MVCLRAERVRSTVHGNLERIAIKLSTDPSRTVPELQVLWQAGAPHTGPHCACEQRRAHLVDELRDGVQVV